VLTILEVLAEDQVVGREMTRRFDGVLPDGRALTVVRGGFLVDGQAPLPASPPPKLGEHSDEILGSVTVRRKPAR
jgi:crotonobetainyl-CoA:carnitine CoA-transferase CaiB-like acyl-CoA transferase